MMPVNLWQMLMCSFFKLPDFNDLFPCQFLSTLSSIFHRALFNKRLNVNCYFFGTALEAEVRQLRTEFKLGRDPRLFFFSGVIRSVNGKHSQASKSIRDRYKACVFCGKKDGLTMAHLISEVEESGDVSLSAFGKPTYVDNLDVKSSRNFILLCGTKGEQGSRLVRQFSFGGKL